MKINMLPVSAPRAYPPRESAFTKEFWGSLAEGRWRTTRCKSCERQTFPPKQFCPHCWSMEVEFSDLANQGVLYSWTRIHAAPAVFGDEAPYACGIVDLDCGIRLACRLVEDAEFRFEIGQRMEMVVLQYTDGPLFAARPMK